MQFTRDPLLPFILTQRAPFDHHEVVTESRRQTHGVEPYLCSVNNIYSNNFLCRGK